MMQRTGEDQVCASKFLRTIRNMMPLSVDQFVFPNLNAVLCVYYFALLLLIVFD